GIVVGEVGGGGGGGRGDGEGGEPADSINPAVHRGGSKEAARGWHIRGMRPRIRGGVIDRNLACRSCVLPRASMHPADYEDASIDDARVDAKPRQRHGRLRYPGSTICFVGARGGRREKKAGEVCNQQPSVNVANHGYLLSHQVLSG